MSGHLNVVSPERDAWLDAIRAQIAGARGPDALAHVSGVRTLDLIGHAVGDDRVLWIGDLAIDPRRPGVIEWFAGIARKGVVAVRLLGCATATTNAGRAAIAAVAEATGLVVRGTNQLLFAHHFGPEGLRPRYRHLVTASGI